MTPGHTPGRDEMPTPSGTHYGQSPAGPVQRGVTHPVEVTRLRRDVFWQNVVREVLMGLSAAAAEEHARRRNNPPRDDDRPHPDSHQDRRPDDAHDRPDDRRHDDGRDEPPDMFDGRMGVITVQGQRIPIADVVPVFACSAPAATPGERIVSEDIQCTVFRIRTPRGENYTLPITQIVGVHSMSDVLSEKMERAARDMEETDEDGNKLPFGFAAYTSLANSERQNADSAESTQPETQPQTQPETQPDAPAQDPPRG